MALPDSTCWMLIEGAASGRKECRDDFGRRYEPVVRAYLGARWRDSALRLDVDDAVQEVFLECFREGGALDRVEKDRAGGFRAFLFGVSRNVALRVERARGRTREAQHAGVPDPDDLARQEATLSRLFDQAWAKSIFREAADLQRQRATEQDGAPQVGVGAEKRVELLHLRFHEDLPIRTIAVRWGVNAALLHKEYARARQEFRAALREIVAFHHGGSPPEIERECSELLHLLS